MVELQQLTPDRFDEVYAKFLRDDDPDTPVEQWRRLLDLPWSLEEGHAGYVLVDRGRLVGMLGMIASQRQIGGRMLKFCNLHSWFVDEPYRGHSLLLMRPALRLRDWTLTDLTPTDKVMTISKRLGFLPLDATLRILLPYRLGARRAARYECRVTDDPTEVRDILGEADRRLFDDHQGPEFRHVIARDGDKSCYVIATLVKRYVMPYYYLHYISDPRQFERAHASLRSSFAGRDGSRFMAVDARLVSDLRLPRSFRLPVRSEVLYKPADAQPRDIDTLYSEVSLLNLTTFPDLGHRVRRFAQRLAVHRYNPLALRRSAAAAN